MTLAEVIARLADCGEELQRHQAVKIQVGDELLDVMSVGLVSWVKNGPPFYVVISVNPPDLPLPPSITVPDGSTIDVELPPVP